MTRMIRNTLSVAWKEIQIIARDRGSLVILLLLPLLFGSLYGSLNRHFAAEGENRTVLVNVCLVNEDTGVFGEQVASAISNVEVLSVETLDSAAEVEQAVAEGRFAAGIIIPADFTSAIDSYTPTAVEMIVDPASLSGHTRMIVVGIVNKVVDGATVWGEVQYGIRNILDESGVLVGTKAQTCQAIHIQNLEITMARLREMSRTSRVQVVSQDLEGAVIEGGVKLFFALLFPGVTVMFAFFSVAISGASLLKERETGALRRLLAAPISRGAIIAGKMLGYVVLICVQAILLLGVAHLFFGMPLGESPVALVLLTLTVALVATAMGMMIASLSSSPKQADNVGTVLGFVLGGLGGCVAYSPTPLTRTEGYMAVLARLTPHGHAVDAYYSLMGEKATLIEILPEIGILLVMGLVFFLIATWRFRWERSTAA